jgi:hypothetical protein
MPIANRLEVVARGAGKSTRSAQKDAGRKSRLDDRRLQLKTAPLWFGDEERGGRPPAGVTGGVKRLNEQQV